MATGKALNGKPYAGNPHVRFDEGEVAPAATPRRGSLLYRRMTKSRKFQYGSGKSAFEVASGLLGCACDEASATYSVVGVAFPIFK